MRRRIAAASPFVSVGGLAVELSCATTIDSREAAFAPPLPIIAEPPLPRELDIGAYEAMSVAIDPVARAMWCFIKAEGPSSFTPGLLRDLGVVHSTVHRLYRDSETDGSDSVRFCVVGSNVPGVFNLGGDLALFLRCIRSDDVEALRAYAHACVEAVFCCSYGVEAPCLSIALVEGDALGGGLEAAMSFHFLIAERGTRFGLPEAMFNLFPGMGAYSFLARKVGSLRAEKLILSGKIYTAEDFHDMGIVDVLAEKGGGREAARKFIRDNERRHALLWSLQRVRRRVNPLAKQELIDVVDIWVDTAMNLDANDLRRMEYLLTAQGKRRERTG